ncbi:hypothetical protein TDB9533_04433 [Thalassocella blandensis]|nr:hypothetical protein TDB9533_04433 [Thalassocella blandensis]
MNKQKYYLPVREFFSRHPEISPNPRKLGLSAHDKEARVKVAANLSRFRKSMGMSQSRFAGILDVSLSQYKKYESGSESIRLDVSHRMALKCGMPIFYLLFGTKYAEYLPLPKFFESFNRIWFFANLLTDEYFEKLCRVLLCFTNELSEINISPSGVTKDIFDLALDENLNDIYLATSLGIKAAREHFDYSQDFVAETMEVAPCTYQEYEKAANRPKYNIFIAARYCICLGINPFHVLVNTHYMKIRTMQNGRIEIIQRIVEDIGEEKMNALTPIVEGFYEAIKDFPDSVNVKL